MDFSKEFWRKVSVNGCEDGYEVSSLGGVRKTTRFKLLGERVKLLKPLINFGGYPSVALFKRMPDGTRQSFRIAVHILVAKAFVAGEQKWFHVHHIDENKLNAAATNLAWVSPHENAQLVSKPLKRYSLELCQRVFESKKKHGKWAPVAREFGITAEVAVKLYARYRRNVKAKRKLSIKKEAENDSDNS